VTFLVNMNVRYLCCYTCFSIAGYCAAVENPCISDFILTKRSIVSTVLHYTVISIYVPALNAIVLSKTIYRMLAMRNTKAASI
jgi:hypothetical protein